MRRMQSNDAMKILFLLRAFNLGGAQRQVIALAGGLHKRGHDVGVAVFYNDSHYERQLQDCGVRLYPLEKSGRWDIGSFLVKLVRLVRTERPDILHAYLGVPNACSVLMKLLFPGLRVVCGIRSSARATSGYGWLESGIDKAIRWIGRYADLTISNSVEGAEYAMGGGVPERRIIVIPNGIDVDAFSPDPEGRARLRKEWGVSPEEPLIGIVGRVHPIKDHKSFLQAALLLLQEEPSFKFVVVGEGVPEYESELKMFAKQMNVEDRVIWAGVRSDLRSVYSSLDVLCSSSYSEGFSNVIGEAMACGVPCAVTDVGIRRGLLGSSGPYVRPAMPLAWLPR